MKNLVKIAFLFVVAVIALASCSKDQKCVNWLEGEWTVSKMEVTDSNGVTVDMATVLAAQGLTMTSSMVFEKYSVKNDEMGTATTYSHVTGSVLGFPVDERDTTVADYKIQDDCETVWMKDRTATDAETAEILESSKTKMVISMYDETEKSTTKVTIEKK